MKMLQLARDKNYIQNPIFVVDETINKISNYIV